MQAVTTQNGRVLGAGAGGGVLYGTPSACPVVQYINKYAQVQFCNFDTPLYRLTQYR